MNINIGKAIYTILSTDTEIKNLIGDKIFPLIANNGTTFPFVVYKRNSMTPIYEKDKFFLNTTYNMDLVIASDLYEQSITVAEKIIEKLKGIKGEFNGVNISKIDILDSGEDFLEDTYIQNINIKIIVK